MDIHLSLKGSRLGPGLATQYPTMLRRRLASRKSFRRTPDRPGPLFSVIMPVYNRAHCVMDAIQSLQAQTLNDWELIAVDDGSTDTTWEVLKAVALQDPRISCIRQSNRGPAVARNLAIECARGEYVAFLDSDDRFEINHLETADAIIREMNPDIIRTGIRVLGSPWVADRDDPKILISAEDVIITGRMIIRTEAVFAVGGFPDLKYSEDGALFLALKEWGAVVATSQARTYVYNRLSEDSISARVISGHAKRISPHNRK